MQFNKKNVLIFPAGSEIGIEIFHSLNVNHHVRVFGASGKSDHAEYLYPKDRYCEDNFYIEQPDFVENLNQLIERWEISFIYPTHDSVALTLAKFQSRINAVVVGSNYKANDIARHKKKTFNLFKAETFCPKLFEPSTTLPFPVYVKPNDSQGGKGNMLIHDIESLKCALSNDPSLVVTEYLPGEELSVDCFTDFNGQLLFVGPRTRERVQMGISFRSRSVELTKEIENIASTINSKLKPNGSWFFQIKQDAQGEYKLLEVAVRQASTMGLYRLNGINFALLSLFNAQKLPVKVMDNALPVSLDRCLFNRYSIGLKFESVYIDYDETLILDDKINVSAIAFLHELKNKNTPIYLITKHRGDLEKSLNNFAISSELFTEIIHLNEAQEKHEYITAPNPIFIDNYFLDRQKVAQHKGIPVFDVDAIDGLRGL